MAGPITAWRDLARCAETDPDAFFPEKGESGVRPKLICQACEVRAECLDYALEHQITFGIWGGLSTKERRRYRRESTGMEEAA